MKSIWVTSPDTQSTTSPNAGATPRCRPPATAVPPSATTPLSPDTGVPPSWQLLLPSPSLSLRVPQKRNDDLPDTLSFCRSR
jgi:hypothetical protein